MDAEEHTRPAGMRDRLPAPLACDRTCGCSPGRARRSAPSRIAAGCPPPISPSSRSRSDPVPPPRRGTRPAGRGDTRGCTPTMPAPMIRISAVSNHERPVGTSCPDSKKPAQPPPFRRKQARAPIAWEKPSASSWRSLSPKESCQALPSMTGRCASGPVFVASNPRPCRPEPGPPTTAASSTP